MPETLETLTRKMEAAALALDFEEARRCRDMINLMRGGASFEEARQADTSGLVRQRPGAMGLGTEKSRTSPPPDWQRPAKPDPLTTGGRDANPARPHDAIVDWLSPVPRVV